MFRVVLDSNVIARAVMSPNGLAANLLTQLVKSAPQITRDINDDPVVETAILSSSQYLCSLDKDILAHAVVEYCQTHGVIVLNDVELLNVLRDSA